MENRRHPVLIDVTGDRHGEEKAATEAFRTFDPDSAAMRFDNALDDRQPQTGAPAPGVVGLPETVEQARHVLLSDSRPRVADVKLNVSSLRPSSDDDAAARCGELDRVTNQVFEDLEQAVAIGPDLGKVLFHVEL